ncbi:MAG: glycosyltransferase family 2 protein [Patescibacteria group bacterium]|nr:glycosyltransferase family 2 protein [Patescibacteria group bacterium]MDD5172652.1 glycosyltransferase family 2 protein [Patescibacteria group bacterium]
MNIKKPKIAVVIVTYNGRKYISDCFNSLKKQTLPVSDIICVDNASRDETIEYLEKKFPESNLIKNKKNQGFAQANNQGIQMALQNNPDYVFLLNQDTICRKDCLEKLAEQAEKEKENIFAWQPLIFCWPQKDLIQTAGDKIHYLGFGFCGDYKKSVNQLSVIKNQLPDITYASGAAMFINASALKKVGFLDKDLFLYHEDLDLCLRARFLGYEIKLAPTAIIYHKYTEGIPKHRWYWSERNRLLTLLKFYKLPTLILIFPAWLFMEIGVWGFSLLTGWFHLKLKSYFTCLWQIPKTLIKRRKLQKMRKIKDRQLAEFLEAEFSFAGFDNPIIKKIVNPILGIYWKIVKKIIFW